jgi:intein/homing endonuclease
MEILLPAQVNQIKALRKSGLAYKKIARQLEVSSSTVYKYAVPVQLEAVQRNQLRENELKNWRRFTAGFAKEKDIRYPAVNETFSRLLGHFFFDGSVSYGDGKFKLSFYNASRRAIDCFVSDVNICFGLNDPLILWNEGKNTGWFGAQFYSKKAFLFLKTIASTFSTSKNACVPDLIKFANQEVKAAFLRAFWDDEGSICDDGELVGGSVSEVMIDGLIVLHHELGIHCHKRIVNRSPRPFYTMVIDRTEQNYARFIAAVGFESAIITKGYHIGKYKKDILAKKFKERYCSP